MTSAARLERTFSIAEYEKEILDTDLRYELIEGKLAPISPTGGPHGKVTMTLSAYLTMYAFQKHLGIMFGAETAFTIDPVHHTILAPDFGFVRAGRLPKPLPEGAVPIPPDLAVEVVSPSDMLKSVRAKVQRYISAGVLLVWVIDPQRKRVDVYRPNSETPQRLMPDDVLDGEDVVPGFTLKIALLFE